MTKRGGLLLAIMVGVSLSTAAQADRVTGAQDSPYDRAAALFDTQSYRAARIELLKELKARPDNPLARLLNARVALESGAGVAAQTEIEKARAAGIPADRTYHLLAHAFVLQGKSEAGLTEADLARVPRRFAAYGARVRGRAYATMLQPDRAKGEFDTAASLAPDNVPILLDRARFALLSRDRATAERDVDHILALRPGGAPQLVLKGDLVRARLGLARALPYFTRALEADPASSDAALERASTYIDLRREAEARADLRRVTDVQPDQPLALYLAAVLEMRAGDYAQAQSLMLRTRGALDDYMPAAMLQGVVASQLGNPNAADTFLTHVVTRLPDYALARRFLASARLADGNPDGAVEALRPVADAASADAAVLTQMGEAYVRTGDLKSAQPYFQRALTAAPNAPGLRSQLAMIEAVAGDTGSAIGTLQPAISGEGAGPGLTTLALIQLRAGNYPAALTAANRLIALKPAIPTGYDFRGSAKLGLRDAKGAEADFRAALQRDPKFTLARRNLARLLLATGRTAAASEQLIAALRSDPRDARAMLMLSEVAKAAGRPTDRIQWASQAVNADRTALAPRLALAQAYIQAGQADKAVTDARAAERDFPDNALVVKTVGLAHMAAKDGSAAESAFRRVVSMTPTDLEARRLIAQAQMLQGDARGAQKTLAEALATPRPGLIAVYLDAIRVARANDDGAGAAWLIARMRTAYPTSNLPDILTGDSLLATGRRPQAIAAYEAARRLSFDRAVALRLAAAYREGGQPTQAMATLQAYATANPRDRAATVAIGEIQMALGRYRAAAATFEALSRAAADPVTLNNLAWSYHQIGDRRALPVARRAMALAPASWAAKDTLGTILVDSRADAKTGLTLISQAVKARPSDPSLRYHLAVAYVANGDPAKARSELGIALKSPRFEGRSGAAALAKRLGRR